MSMVTRFAPSPTGRLHLGHARAALLAWRAARAAGGRFLLRLEDIDPGRCRPDFAAAIIEDLAWLGLDWDGPVRTQSAHLPEYRAVLDRLLAEGLVYRCFCTRADVALAVSAPQGPEGPVYPGTCRAAAGDDPGRPHAWRLDMTRALRRVGRIEWHERGQGPVAGDPAAFGDVVLGRRDAPASYHLCATHDDAVQGVTLVTRGVDLAPATAVHRVLQRLLHWPEPQYRHHALVTDTSGRRLAKRDGAATLAALRAAGLAPDAVAALALGEAGPQGGAWVDAAIPLP